MIKDEVERCMKKHDRNISWLSKKLGVSWTAVKDKLNKDTFTGTELLDLCIIFEDFNFEKLIDDRRFELIKDMDDNSEIKINISGNKIGTLYKNLGWQSFKDKNAEELFNNAIPELTMGIKKSLALESDIFKEMDLLGLNYSIENIN